MLERSIGGSCRQAIWWKRLARDRDVTVIAHYATAMGILRFNHLHPPFNNVAVRRALLGAVDQADAMTAVAGTDRTFWHDGIVSFRPERRLPTMPESTSCAARAITRRLVKRWPPPAIMASRSSSLPRPNRYVRCC